MAKNRWTNANIPDQAGRIAVITGANKGLGFATANALAQHGAHVVLAVRDPGAGAAALDRIRSQHPGASGEVQQLDLSSLNSVRQAAEQLADRHARIDLLINNAGMISETRKQTVDGYEIQFATNHLGPFALTGLLLDRMKNTAGARVVTVSSIAAHSARNMIDDPNWEHAPYDSNAVYGWSKLASQLFAFELQRRLAAAGYSVSSLAAHPGGAATEGVKDLIQTRIPVLLRPLARLGLQLLFNSAADGALPSLRAATDPAALGGQFYGPDGFKNARGLPIEVSPSPLATDLDLARRLWSLSEDLTGVRYGLG